MARTTATVTVGADTRPFEKKMKTLGSGLKGGGGIGGGIGGAAMSGLGFGAGALGALAGIRGFSSLLDNLKAVSPKLAGALESLTTSLQESLKPAAIALADVIIDKLPLIEEALESAGVMLGDAVKFWTEEAFDPAVWKDLAAGITDAVKSLLGNNATVNNAVDTMVANRGAGATAAVDATIAAMGGDEPSAMNTAFRWLIKNKLTSYDMVLNDIGLNFSNTEGAISP